MAGVVAGELAVALDDVAANDHCLNVGGTAELTIRLPRKQRR
jgi:hypothetical protein